MKILILNHGLHISGVSRALVNFANELCRHGHDVTVKIEINDFTLAEELDPRIKTSLFLKEPTLFGKRIKGFLRFYPIWLENVLKRKASSQYRAVVREKYDIEIAFNRGAGAKIISGSSKKHSKYVFAHSDYLKCSNPLAGFSSKEEAASAYKKFDKVICVSKKAKESFDTLFDTSNTTVAYNIYDIERIRELSKHTPFDKKKFTVCAVGRLCEAKNYSLLLDVCRELNDRGLDFECYIVGKGEDLEMMLKKKTELKLDNVILVGATPNPYSYMAQSDVYVSTSIYEGLSTTTIEALILNKPCVVTNCTGMEEILCDGERTYGMIVPIDKTAVADAIESLYKDPKKLEEMKSLAAIRAGNFETEKLYERIMSVIK